MGVHDEKTTEHPAFGVLTLNRVQSTPRMLFGSNVRHQNYIAMRLYRARHILNKDLQTESIMPDDVLADFSLSEVQLSQLLFGADRGSGVPVTLEKIREGKMSDTKAWDTMPVTTQAKDYSEELAKDLLKLKQGVKKVSEKLGAMERGGAVKKADLKELFSEFNKVEMEISSNMEFLFKQFEEKMEKVVMEAKGEIEAHFKNRITSLGLEAVAKNPVKLLEEKPEK